MYSLITKIAHSRELKDAIGVARGVYRVLTSRQSKQQQGQWIERMHKIENVGSELKYRQGYQPQKNQLSIQPQIQKVVQINIPQPPKQDSSSFAINPQVVAPKQNASQKTIQKNVQSIVQPKIQLKQSTNLQWQTAIQNQRHKQSKVISSRFGRFFEYTKLGTGLLGIQLQAQLSKSLGMGNQQQIYEKGAQKITQQLCKMRGAPLKIAQMLSIQQDALIPAPIRRAFQKAREQAHIMPQKEVAATMKQYLGQNWRSKFSQFDMKPFAAASIGQVHKAKIANQQLAVKLQYPGVQKSITSDIKNLNFLLKLPGVMPKGIFIEKLLANVQKELKQQCDYENQAKMQQLYNKCLTQVMGKDYIHYAVPKINHQLSGKYLIVSQLLRGVGVSRFQSSNIPQSIRDEVGRLILKLTFSEIFQMGIMQSDPNPSNFTYNQKEGKLNLFDFGATHIYPKEFLQNYCEIINSSVREDKPGIIQNSVLAGFLTRQQNTVMLAQHTQSIMILGQPLRHKGIYDFGSQQITQRIYKTIPLMLKNRLKAPPEQVYSLHRKLSGAYLSCIRMRAKVDCSKIYRELKQGYRIQQLI